MKKTVAPIIAVIVALLITSCMPKETSDFSNQMANKAAQRFVSERKWSSGTVTCKQMLVGTGPGHVSRQDERISDYKCVFSPPVGKRREFGVKTTLRYEDGRWTRSYAQVDYQGSYRLFSFSMKAGRPVLI
jgi:hypothetical protein